MKVVYNISLCHITHHNLLDESGWAHRIGGETRKYLLKIDENWRIDKFWLWKLWYAKGLHLKWQHMNGMQEVVQQIHYSHSFGLLMCSAHSGESESGICKWLKMLGSWISSSLDTLLYFQFKKIQDSKFSPYNWNCNPVLQYLSWNFKHQATLTSSQIPIQTSLPLSKLFCCLEVASKRKWKAFLKAHHRQHNWRQLPEAFLVLGLLHLHFVKIAIWIFLFL